MVNFYKKSQFASDAVRVGRKGKAGGDTASGGKREKWTKCRLAARKGKVDKVSASGKKEVDDDVVRMQAGGKGKIKEVAAWVGEKKKQLGRSMMEMLGVLAIIGVLSIASISAYSQAMFKYQLNKFSEDFSTLLNNAISIWPDLHRQYGSGTSKGVFLDRFFANTSLLPDSISYDEKQDALLDIFKNRLRIYYAYSYYSFTKYVIYYAINKDGDKASARGREVCRAVLLVAQKNAENIYRVTLNWGSQEDLTTGDKNSFTPERLKKSGLTEIDTFCKGCNSKKSCTLIVYMNH